MPDSTSRVLTFINVSFSDCFLTRRPLCVGDNAGFSPAGPQRLLRIVQYREVEGLWLGGGGGDAGRALAGCVWAAVPAETQNDE